MTPSELRQLIFEACLRAKESACDPNADPEEILKQWGDEVEEIRRRWNYRET